MPFFLMLALINVACFLPLYLLSLRIGTNPFPPLPVARGEPISSYVKLLYVRVRSPDPFRINFDFTFAALLAAAANATGPAMRGAGALLLMLGLLEILYTSVMHSIFLRPPVLVSDLSLLRTGIGLARRQLYWMIPLAALMLLLLWLSCAAAVSLLFDLDTASPWLALVVAGLLLPPCFHHCARDYGSYLWRMVYSPGLHLYLNIRFGRLTSRLTSLDAAHYRRLNDYDRVSFAQPPNVVIVCVESYGSMIYRDPRYRVGVEALLQHHEWRLGRAGYHFASTFSDAPLFAGGSWLSYASFAYGTAIADVQSYDALFSRPSNFGAYESLFHVLGRNGYRNVLLCPLGGVDTRTMDWDAVDRCFQPHLRISFEDLEYVGPTVPYFGVVLLHAALDQFALNFGYERALESKRPFSLFFCTLNSHYPWHSAAEATDDWRALNTPTPASVHESRRPVLVRYNAAIRYQLDYILRFAMDRAADEPLIILFGDHQPPTITPEHLGKATPVHVIGRDRSVIDAFLAHGFAPTLDLTGEQPTPIRHEGFLSLLMKAMHSAYGTEPGLDLPYRERGRQLFDAELQGVQ